MSRRNRHYKRERKAIELDVTTFLNLMVVLIPFLLASAVFSQVNIQELNLPAEASGASRPDTPLVTIEIMVRKSGLEIGDGKVITDKFPKKNEKYDFVQFSKALQELKKQYPDKQDVNVLLEPDIEYNDMISVMDAVKVTQVAVVGKSTPDTVVLFPEISIGDTP